MPENSDMEQMLNIFVFETVQLMEQLEQIILASEKENGLKQHINEIFRIMHTIKGSSAMMSFNNISLLSHSIEDVFYNLREYGSDDVEYSCLTDIILSVIDFIQGEVAKIKNNQDTDGDPSNLIGVISGFMRELNIKRPNYEIIPEEEIPEMVQNQQFNSSNEDDYRIVLYFEDDCQMENIRAFAVIHMLKQVTGKIRHIPDDLLDECKSVEEIRKNGFVAYFSSDHPESEIRGILEETLFLKELMIEKNSFSEGTTQEPELKIHLEDSVDDTAVRQSSRESSDSVASLSKLSYISVNIEKMNKLMDLVGELVISEAMVTQNPELDGLVLDSFRKASRQLRKITGELQDIVMSMRMVPLSTTFQKMNRIVRDMSRKLNKEVNFKIIGEETEVDKNIIEHISDPLIHLIRNALDHGLETKEERKSKEKPEQGELILEAKNSGGDVCIVIKDDGRGLDKDKILRKASELNIIQKHKSELTDREIYSMILLPGFSTKDEVTEYSGRGVGMDVVTKNIEKVRGTVLIDSTPDLGTSITIKIPLTLAILDGMIVKVGDAAYTIPTVSIRESLKIEKSSIIKDPNGNEMIMIRGQCYPVLRLHHIFNVETDTNLLEEGIIVVVENEANSVCLFADTLVGEQQVVIKALPQYLKKVNGISGCTLLGDGSISLIIDISSLINSKE